MSRFHHNIHFSKRAQGCYIFWAFSSLWIPSCGPCLLDIWHDIEVTQLCPILCDPMDCSLPGSSVHGIFQARVLEWVAISFSRRSSNPGIKPGSPALQADALSPEPPVRLVSTLWNEKLNINRTYHRHSFIWKITYWASVMFRSWGIEWWTDKMNITALLTFMLVE